MRGRKLVKHLPADRLLTETDGPFTLAGRDPACPWDAREAAATMGATGERPIDEVKDQIRSNLATPRPWWPFSDSGMTRVIEDLSPKETETEYLRFHKWLTRSLSSMDPAFDLLAQRATAAQDLAALGRRTPEQHRRSKVALRLSERVINSLIAASVLDATSEGYRGDVVADESILHVSNQNRRGEDGTWMRSAVAVGAYYSHEKPTGEKHGKRGHGIGVTAVIRVGSPGSMHSVVPVVTGIAIHTPTSGTPRHMDTALAHHRANGFDVRAPRKNATHPFCVTDMGYSAKKDYAARLFKRSYSLLSRFPIHHGTAHALPSPAGVETGVFQIGGDVYCPCAEKLKIVRSDMVIGTRGLDAAKAEKHDRLLQPRWEFHTTR